MTCPTVKRFHFQLGLSQLEKIIRTDKKPYVVLVVAISQTKLLASFNADWCINYSNPHKGHEFGYFSFGGSTVICVFEKVYLDPVRVVALGRKIEDLLTNPGNDEWLSLSAELCGYVEGNPVTDQYPDHNNRVSCVAAKGGKVGHCEK
ncbi:PREDICTED: uncharacterized protein LOC109189804 isoform X2 [Ipomoea nil]|uniref:uncharacterized protein LOC109189804 isoform X2 n=1 Tax=Ipomoea nil TaxID=35883 RepID=UPI0009012E62|nr:PREDICTED: uncharacterized protein LOC109189804 isoform X2 [Ipomoea nil]